MVGGVRNENGYQLRRNFAGVVSRCGRAQLVTLAALLGSLGALLGNRWELGAFTGPGRRRWGELLAWENGTATTDDGEHGRQWRDQRWWFPLMNYNTASTAGINRSNQ